MENKPTFDQQLRKLRTMLYVRWFATKDCLNASMAFGLLPNANPPSYGLPRPPEL